MKIHFICRGNTFRSRLAEALTRQRYPGHEISSSGLEADLCLNGHITWYAQWIATKEGLESFVHPTWRKTNVDDLAKQDVVVCLDETIAKEIEKYSLPYDSICIFSIPDVQTRESASDKDFDIEISLLRQTSEIFELIRKSLDNPDFLSKFTAT